MNVPTLEDRIRSARAARELSASELARAIGVTSAAVSRWENGLVKHLRSEHLFPMARLLRVNAEWLATGKGLSGIEDERNALKAEEPRSGYSIETTYLENTSHLSEEEQSWLEIYRRLSPSIRTQLKAAFGQWVSSG